MDNLPDGIFSLLDTDLYKLTMQCAVLQYFPDTHVSYSFTNRTPHMKLNRKAYVWLQEQIQKLGDIPLSQEEFDYLKSTCPYLSTPYLYFLHSFRLRPSEHIELDFRSLNESQNDDVLGDVHIEVSGLWIDTILYEIPLLALVSEAYFKFCDKDWTHHGQEQSAYEKGRKLLENGCVFSEFGSRRRRDYHTQDLVVQGLRRASENPSAQGDTGNLSGTSNVHFAMKHQMTPVGTVAHEWFMGIAAGTNDYEHASETALKFWIGCFGQGVLGISLTDTFGTPVFLRAFKQAVPTVTAAIQGAAAVLPSPVVSSNTSTTDNVSETRAPSHALTSNSQVDETTAKSYAQVFSGVRQDSGDPLKFIQTMRDFYDGEGIKEKKTIIFSDSLNVEKCIDYRQAAEEAGFQPSFGVGTFFTNDFTHVSNGQKSVPLNIVIKISSVNGTPAIKISDNIGKNTGDSGTVEEVKARLGYIEKQWSEGDERIRWGKGAEV